MKMGGRKPVRLILGLLDDPSAALRAYAAQSLGSLAAELGAGGLANEVAKRLFKMLSVFKMLKKLFVTLSIRRNFMPSLTSRISWVAQKS